MKTRQRPIIRSLLDLDLYKLTMCMFAYLRYPAVRVKYEFKNRTKDVRLADFVSLSDLKRELAHVRSLRFTKKELAWLGTNEHTGLLFKEKFLGFLAKLRLPAPKVWIEDGELRITVEGTWAETILWETIILSIVNELYYRSVVVDLQSAYNFGFHALDRKCGVLKKNPQIQIIEFGTRRRFSAYWQRRVIENLILQIPKNLLGTSNVLLAYEYGLRPIGTFAHELPMIFTGIYAGSDEEIRSSHGKCLDEWYEVYEATLSVALTDTFGTEFFFRDMGAERAAKWRGLRQDSGDPIEFGHNAVAFYKSHGIDPKSKSIVFSDALYLELVVHLWEEFHEQINVLFGWGTDLTNDLGLKSLSLVMKAVEANGHSLVKLSDNVAKAMGPEEAVERIKCIFGHTGTTSEPLRS